jgi:hypothetical protein
VFSRSSKPELFASPEVHVRRRRRWAIAGFSASAPVRVARPALSDHRPGRRFAATLAWPPAPRFQSARGPVRVVAVIQSPPLAGGGGVLRGCVRFGVVSRDRPAVVFRGSPRDVQSSPARPTLACPRGGRALLIRARSRDTAAGPAGAPLLRFSFPYSVHWPCRAVRCCRHPDDPASAFRTAPPPTPAGVSARMDHGRSSVRDRWRRGPPPLRFSACARRRGHVSPAATVRAPARTGHAPPLLHGRCSATRASHRTAWPVPAPPRGTSGAPGVLPFAALFPPAGVAALPPLGPTCRFPGALSRRAVAFYVSSGRPVARHPLSGSRADLPQVTGRGSWASSPRAIRSTAVTLCVTAAADAALDFASLRYSVVCLLTPFELARPRGAWPLGFAGVMFRRDQRRAGLRLAVLFCVSESQNRLALAPSATGHRP